MSGCYCLVIAFRSMNSPQRSLVKKTLRYPLNLPLQKLFIVKWVVKVIYLIYEMSQKKKLSMACQDKFVVPVMSITHHLRVITISLGFSLVCSAIHSWMLFFTLQPENPINIWIPCRDTIPLCGSTNKVFLKFNSMRKQHTVRIN